MQMFPCSNKPWFKWWARHQALLKPHNDPFIWIRAVVAGNLRTRTEEHCAYQCKKKKKNRSQKRFRTKPQIWNQDTSVININKKFKYTTSWFSCKSWVLNALNHSADFFSCCLFFFRDKSWWKPIQSHVLSTHIPKAVLLPHTHTAPFNMHKRLTTTNALTQLSTPWVAGRHWDIPWDRGERGAEPVDGGGYIQSLESRQLTGE